MESCFGIALADYGTRVQVLNSLIEKAKKGETFNLQDENGLLELVLLLHGRNTKLIGPVIELLAMMLQPNSYHCFSKVIPYITDFLGVAKDENLIKLKKVYKDFFRLSKQQQQIKLIKDGLDHPSLKVNVSVMDIFASLDGLQAQDFHNIKEKLKNKLSESKEEKACKNIKDRCKKMVVNQPFSEIPESNKEFSKQFKSIEKEFEECLSRQENRTYQAQNIKSLKSDLAYVPDDAGKENVKQKISALMKLRSAIGLDNFSVFAGLIRKAIRHQHPEIVKEAIITVTSLLLKKMLSKESEEYIQLLIQCLDSSSDTVSMFAFVALQHLIKGFPTQTMLINILFNVTSESPAIRRKVSLLLLETLNHFANHWSACFLGLEQAMEYGIRDKDSEVQAQWRRIFLKFPNVFERMTKRICFTDDKDKGTIIRKSSSCNDPEDDNDILNDMKLSDISIISSGHSIVLNATFLGNKVTVRKVLEGDEKRIKRERLMFKLTRTCHGFTPVLHELNFTNMLGFVMPQFELNLADAVLNNFLQKEVDKVKIINDIAKALEYIHSQGFIHNSLQPNHVLLHFSSNGFKGLIRNFGRSGLESETPEYPPSVDWTAPEALAAPGNFSKSSDMYSLGLLSYFVLSGCDHKGKDLRELVITKDLKLSKPYLGFMAVSCLTVPVADRPTAKLFQIFPIFWKHRSYRFYVERLREFFRRNDDLMKSFAKISIKWLGDKEIISEELKDDMKQFKNYEDNLVDLVFFLRNLSLHGRESEVKRSICGDNNELLEGWIEKNFEEQVMDVFKNTHAKYDDQLISELLSITLFHH